MKHSKASIFLMEIILNIFFFTILITICLQVFLKANTLSQKSVQLQQAVTCCASLAEVFQSTSDGQSSLLSTYPDSTNLEDSILIYFDENYNACHQSEASYKAIISFSTGTVSSATINFYALTDVDSIYSLTVSSYTQQVALMMGGGLRA